MTARDDVLARIEAALGAAPKAPSVPREYRVTTGHAPGSVDVIDRFVDRLVDYDARVHRASSGEIEAQVVAAIGDEESAVVPVGLPDSWRAAVEKAVAVVRIDGQPANLQAAELDETGVVVTACRVAIAETGTIVLDAEPDQGRRAITLIPDHHVVVVLADQVVASVPEALARLEPTRPLTFISGPSATSDIEFQRVQGVHGPRRLDVIVVADDVAGSGPPPQPQTADARSNAPGHETSS